MRLEDEKVDILDIFYKNDTLQVPKYQRGYKWDESSYSEMWDDIATVILDKDEHHFFGFVILSEIENGSSQGEYEVIDGQQRLTTFSILFRAMHDLCSTANGNKDNIYEQVFSADGGSSYKLCLGDVDEPFFEKYIKRPQTNRSRTGKLSSHKRIRMCYEFFVDRIKQYASDNEKSEDEVVNLLYKRLQRNVHILVLKTGSDVDAYAIFESINAKRVDLTPAELLKNYFFSTASRESDAALKETQQNWDAMTNDFEDAKKSPEITDYIRHYWISSKADVQASQLYKTVKASYRQNPSRVKEFISSLKDEVELYTAIYNPQNGVVSSGIKTDSITELDSLGYRQAYPVLLSLLSQQTDQQTFDGCVRNMTSMFVRRSIAGANPNEVEKRFSSISRMLRTNLQQGLDALKSAINELTPPDDEVISKTTKGRTPLAKHILSEYELSLSAPGGKKLDSPTLEHVMPQQPRSYADWGVDSDEHMEWFENIGNLTLLEKPINSSVKNNAYDLKRAEYASQHTDMKQTVEIVEKYEEWGVEQIQQRANQLALFVNNRWKIN